MRKISAAATQTSRSQSYSRREPATLIKVGEEAASRFQRLADELDPAAAKVDDLSDLRAVAEAADQVRHSEAMVTERVAAARAKGRSWNRIAIALGVSRQAARHRFADKIG